MFMFHRNHTAIVKGCKAATISQRVSLNKTVIASSRSIWDIKPLQYQPPNDSSNNQAATTKSHHDSSPAALLLTMNSNPVNAMNPKFFSDLHETLDVVAEQYSPHVPLLLTNVANSRTFSAGVDLQYVQSIWHSEEKCTEFVEMINSGFIRLYTVSNPTIAVVNGHNIAGGTVLQFACDFRVMPLNDKVMTSLREVDLGLNLPSCVAEMMRQQFQGPSNVLYDIALTGRMLTPSELKSYGLLTDSVDWVHGETQEQIHAKLMEKALAIACRTDYRVSGKAFELMKKDFKRPLTINTDNDAAFVGRLMDPVVQQRIQQMLQSTKK